MARPSACFMAAAGAAQLEAQLEDEALTLAACLRHARRAGKGQSARPRSSARKPAFQGPLSDGPHGCCRVETRVTSLPLLRLQPTGAGPGFSQAATPAPKRAWHRVRPGNCWARR